METNHDMNLSHLRPTNLREFLYGVPYYPEHWDAATREGDPALFAGAGWNVVRMAEFAWDLMEPREGVFDFSLFDETIERLGAVGIRTILCTPTAAPPRWLTKGDPAVLRVDADGRPLQHGSRQHASHFSASFREASRRITSAMSAHYRENPQVIGWQTDNEFHCHFREDYSAAAQAAWVVWLRERFRGDVDALNTAWGTAFWAQTYNDFEDVELPRAGRPTHCNPSQWLDFQRFLSDGVTTFQREQVEILRAAQPRWFVTHNGCFGAIDYRGNFVKDLDFLAYDSYPFFESDPANRAANHAANLDYTRAYSGHFIIPEQQSGAGGQGAYFHDKPEPGEMRRMAWTSIARGADGLLFFRERSCRFGAEEYWEGIIDHDNVPRRRYREAAQLGAELQSVGRRLLGSSVRVDVAVAGGDFAAQHGHDPISLGLPSPRHMGEAVHSVFFRAGYAVGFVHPSDSLAGVKLYVIPHFAIFDPLWLGNLEAFVREGGTLVIGARTASRDLQSRVVSETLPGVLRCLCGVTVEEFGRQNRPDRRPHAVRFGASGDDVPTSLWYEYVQPEAEGVEVIGEWTTRHLNGKPAVTRRRIGEGQVIYVGTYLTREFTAALLPMLDRLGGLPAALTDLEGVEVVERVFEGSSPIRVVINHREEAVRFPLPAGFSTDLLGGKVTGGELNLEPSGVAVLTSDR